MKGFISFTILFFTITLSAQTSAKKEYLFDENNNVITQQEFKLKTAAPEYTYTYIIIKNDTAVIAKTVLRREYGILSQEDRERIISELKNVSGKSISDDQTIVINFFYTNRTNNKTLAYNHYPADAGYKKFIRKHPQYAQFFITEKGLLHKENYVYEDTGDVIRNMLFKYPFEANYIIIKPNGHYFRHVGEYRQDEIPDILQADW